MSDVFIRQLLNIAIGQICGSAGFQAMKSESLHTLQDLVELYILQLSRTCQSLAEIGKRKLVNFSDVTRAFEWHQVKLVELELFLHEVEEIPFLGPLVSTIPLKKHGFSIFYETIDEGNMSLRIDQIPKLRELESSSITTKSSLTDEIPTTSPLTTHPLSVTAVPAKTTTLPPNILEAYRKAVQTADQTIHRMFAPSSSITTDEVSRSHTDLGRERTMVRESEPLKLKIKLSND
jgi:histone H3/H4